jgi:hypothetical protein
MDITKEWLETCGTASLQGALFKEGIVEPQPVTLWFEQARPEADLIIMPDFVPACLVQSIVDLMKKGYEFRIETYRKGGKHS